MTITTDVVIGNDVICSGNGLLVGADNITIDLGGHTLSGVGSDAHIGVDGGAYFPDENAAHSFTVKNGAIAGFATGIAAVDNGGDVNGVYGANHITVDNLHVIASTGIQITGPNGNTVSHSTFEQRQGDTNSGGINAAFVGGSRADNYYGNTFRNLSSGISLWDEQNVSIDGNTFSSVTRGINIAKTQSVTVSNNTFQPAGVFPADGSAGVVVGEAVEHVTISNNTIGGVQSGILIYGTPPGGGFGISDITVNTNHIDGADAVGIAVLGDTQNNIFIENNGVFDSGDRPGSATNAPMGTEPLNDGIYVYSNHGLVELINNQADSNADRGIQAIGATDGGGNEAKLNRGPSQCEGIVCS